MELSGKSKYLCEMHSNLYNVNGLVFWTAEEIKFRRYAQEMIADRVREVLIGQNKAWQFHEIEAPVLVPSHLINPNYTSEDVWVQGEDNLVLRPETTPSSYVYARYLLDSNRALPPFVVYQSGKSFRKEQDQVTKNMRLKEFYQMEFQCIFTEDTLNDYQETVLVPMKMLFIRMFGTNQIRIVPSDRLPEYSRRTMDIELYQGKLRWMELCSISLRNDFPGNVKFEKKGGGVVEKNLLVLEIAVGLDRLVYNYMKQDGKDIDS